LIAPGLRVARRASNLTKVQRCERCCHLRVFEVNSSRVTEYFSVAAMRAKIHSSLLQI